MALTSARTEVEQNIRKTRHLIVYFIFIIVAIGLLIDTAIYYLSNRTVSMKGLLITLSCFLLFAFIYTLIAFFAQNAIAIASVRGKEVNESNYPVVYHIVQELTLAARLPMPQVYMIEDPSPNAFATGKDPKHATVAVTTGLLDVMNREELEAVIGHELSHIKNYDIRCSTMAAALSSVIVGIGAALVFSARETFWAGLDERDKDSSTAAMAFALGLLVLGLLIKFVGIPISRLIEFAISRQREYLADVSSTTLTHNPQGMIDALEVLKGDKTPTSKNFTVVRQLCFNAPHFSKVGDKVRKYSGLDTHPPLEDRIKRIRKLISDEQVNESSENKEN